MNLGELYIKISVETPNTSSAESAFNRLADIAEEVSKSIDQVNKSIVGLEVDLINEAISHTPNLASEAQSSTSGFVDELRNAVVQGDLLASAIKGAFETAIDLAKSAANAVSGFVQSSVEGYASYEQNLESLGRTFDSETQNLSGEMMSFFQENSAKYGMTVNEMMEHANKTGIILQKDNAQRRAQEAEGEKQSTEEQKLEIDNRLQDFRASLSAREKEVKNAQADELTSWKNYYADEYDNLKSALSKELDAFKENNDQIYDNKKKELSKQLEALSETLDAEYSELQSSLSKQVDAQKAANERILESKKSAIDAAYEATRYALEKEVDAQKRANEEALSSKQKSVDDAYNAAKKAMDAEVAAYQKATDQRLREINKEYTERYKLIDEQKYAELKAIQDQIDAIDNQQEEASRAAEKRSEDQKRANLTQKVYDARTATERAIARQNLANFEAEVEAKKQRQILQDQRDSLRKQMDSVKDHYDQLKSELKEQQSEEVAEYKESRAEGLAALKSDNSARLAEIKAQGKAEVQAMKAAQSDQIKAMQESNKQRLASMKAAGQAELNEIRRSQSEQIRSMQESNKKALEEKKKSNKDVLSAQKEENEAELKELKLSIKHQEDEMADSHAERLKQQKRFQDEQLNNLKRSQSEELDALKEHNRQLIQEESNAAKLRKKAISDAAKQGPGYAEITDEDKRASMETLERLFDIAANVGAARNMTTDYVLDIFESMNYGRFATFDNLGLGYANKTGIAEMVHDMSESLQRKGLDRELDPENFNDVALALQELIDNFGMSGRAAEEAKNTISGSWNSLRSTWENFKTALATEDKSDDSIFLNQLFYGSGEPDDEGVVANFIENVTPVVGRVLEGIANIIKQKGPELFRKLWDIVVASLPPEWTEELEKLGDTLGDFVDELANGMPTVKDLIDEAKKVFETVNNIIDTLNDITGEEGLGGIGKTIANVAASFGLLWTVGRIKDAVDVFKGLGDAIKPLGGENGALKALGSAAEAAAGAGGASAAGSAGAGAAGAGAVGAGLSGLGATVGEVASGFLGIPAAALAATVALGFVLKAHEDETHAVENFSKAHEGYANASQYAAQKTADVVQEKSQQVISGQKNMGQSADDLKRQFENMSTESQTSISNLADGAKQRSADFDNFFANLFKGSSDTSEGIKTHTKETETQWSSSLDNMKTNTDTSTKSVSKSVSGMLTDIKKDYDSSGNMLKNSGNEIVKGFGNGAENGGAWDSVKKFFGGILDWIVKNKGPVRDDANALKPAGEAIIKGLYEGASGNNWQSTKKFFSDVQGNISKTFNNSGNWLKDSGGKIISGMNAGINDLWRNVTTFFNGVPGQITSHFNNAGSWLGNAGNQIISGLSNGISNAVHTVTNAINGIMNNVMNYFNNAWNWLVGAGQDIINGLVNGLWRSASSVSNALWDIVWGGIENLKSWLGIASPSKLMMELGGYTMEGYTEGIKKMLPEMSGTMGDLAREMENSFDSPELDMSDSIDNLTDQMEQMVETYEDAIEEMKRLRMDGLFVNGTGRSGGVLVEGRAQPSNNLTVIVESMSVRSDDDIYDFANQLNTIWKYEAEGALV